MPEPIALLIVLAPLLLNTEALRHDFRRFVHIFGVSAMVVGFWTLNRVWDLRYDFPDNRVLNPPFEFIGGAVCVWLAVRYKHVWAWVMATLFWALAIVHALFLPGWYFTPWWFQPTKSMSWWYTLDANVLWVVLAVVGGAPGGWNALVRLHDWMRTRSWVHLVNGGAA